MEIWKYSHSSTIGCKKSKNVDFFYSSEGRLKKVFYDGRCEISTPKHKGRNGERIYITIAKLFPETCGKWFNACEVDHINTNRNDNRAINLRCCTSKENMNNELTKQHCRKPKSIEHRKNISISHKGRLAHNRKIVIMSDKNTNEILNMFSSCVEAANVTGLSCGNIPNACNGKYHNSHVYAGYLWQYL